MRRAVVVGLTGWMVAVAGCDLIAGVANPETFDGSGASGEGAGGTAGGLNAGGGGAPPVCEMGETMPCYDGPAGTETTGQCAAGTQTCLSDGTGFGVCEDQVLPGTETCASEVDEDCNGEDCALYAANLSNGAAMNVTDVAVDPEGNFVLVGNFSGELVFGATHLVAEGGGDFFVAKFDPNWSLVWAKAFGDAATQQEIQVAVGPDSSILLGGSFEGTVDFGGTPGPELVSAGGEDAFVAKLSPAGQHLWTKGFGSAGSQEVTDIQVDNVGDVLVGGNFENSLGIGDHTSSGQADIFVAKFPADGTIVAWSKRFGDTAAQTLTHINIRGQSAAFIVGRFLGTVDFGLGPLTANADTLPDLFVTKLEPLAGGAEWNEHVQTSAIAYVQGVALAPDGIVVSGDFGGMLTWNGKQVVSSGADFFIAKFLDDGSVQWAERFGATSADYTGKVAVSSEGDVVFFGTSFGIDFGGGPLAGIGLGDIAIARLGPNAEYRWSRLYGNDKAQKAGAIVLSATGMPTIFFKSEGNIDIESKHVVSTGLDTAVVTFAP